MVAWYRRKAHVYVWYCYLVRSAMTKNCEFSTEVSYKLKFSGTFSDSLDLERLPYDRQLFRIQARFDMQREALAW